MKNKYHMLSNIWMSFSQEEIQRRHGELKRIMKEEQVPAAILFSRDGIMKSWLLGETVPGFAGAGDLLLADGESYSIQDEFLHFRFLEKDEDFEKYVSPSNYEGVKRSSRFSYLPIREAFARAGVHRLGVYQPEEMNASLAGYLEQKLPGTEYVDLTEKFDAVHMVRSEEEIKFAEKSAYILDRAFLALPSALIPGKSEYECVNAIRALPTECIMGDSNAYMKNEIRLVSNPDGEKLQNADFCYPGRYLQMGDRVDVTFHLAGENWVYTMAARSFYLGEQVPEETRNMWMVAVEAAALAARLLKPGETLKKIAGEVNRYLIKKGSRPDPSVFLYSMYNGIQERPCLYDRSENAPLLPGMLIGVCPAAAFGKMAPMRCGDVYQVTEQGGRRLGELSFDLVAVKGLY